MTLKTKAAAGCASCRLIKQMVTRERERAREGG